MRVSFSPERRYVFKQVFPDGVFMLLGGFCSGVSAFFTGGAVENTADKLLSGNCRADFKGSPFLCFSFLSRRFFYVRRNAGGGYF